MAGASVSFIFGLANSLHCAGMCGPLAVCFQASKAGTLYYHTARLVAYLCVGAAAGGLGTALGTTSLLPYAHAMSLVLGVVMIALALGLHGYLGQVPGASGLLGSVLAWTGRLRPGFRPLILGLLTPLLPCGLLYVVYATALVSGNWQAGAIDLLAFGLGSMPVLAFCQLNLGWLQRKLSPEARTRLYKVLLLVAAAVLIVRGFLDIKACCH